MLELIISRAELSKYKKDFKKSNSQIINVPTLGFGTLKFVKRNKIRIDDYKNIHKAVWCLEIKDGVFVEI